MTALRVAVVGAGVMGGDHAALLQGAVHGARVVGVADADLGRATALAAAVRRPGEDVRATDDAAALVAADDVDAVVVASPDATHAGLVRAALAQGRPVLCEKPLAPAAAECRALLAAEDAVVGDGPRLVSVGFMRRFDPGHVALREVVASGDLGAALLLRCTSRGTSSAPGSTTASALSNSFAHEADSVPWLLGSPVVEVSWQAPRSTSRAVGLADPQLLTLRTADGALASCELFLNAGYGHDVRCEVVCEGGAASTAEPVPVVRDAAGARATTYGPDWRRRWAEAYRLELQAWVDAVRAGAPSPLAGAADGLAAAEVVEALVAATTAEGRPVRVGAATGGRGAR